MTGFPMGTLPAGSHAHLLPGGGVVAGTLLAGGGGSGVALPLRGLVSSSWSGSLCQRPLCSGNSGLSSPMLVYECGNVNIYF